MIFSLISCGRLASTGLLLCSLCLGVASFAPRVRRTRRFGHTPETFPRPDQQLIGENCRISYLGVPYICDPSGILSQTEADLIDTQIRESRLLTGYQWDSDKCNPFPDPPYGVFLSLSRNAYWPQLCDNSADTDDLLTTQLQRFGDNFVAGLRGQYSSGGCEVDLMIFCLKEFSCPSRTVGLRHSRLFLSLSDRLLDNISPAARQQLMEFSSGPYSRGHQRCFDQVVQLLQLLNKSTTQPDDDYPAEQPHFEDEMATEQSQSRRSTSPSKWSERPAVKRHTHVIPQWAIVIFVVSAVLSVCCTLLGNFVNTPAHILYCGGAGGLPNLFCRRAHNKRWKVGFGGGLFDMGNSSSSGSASRAPLAPQARKPQYLFRGFSQRKQNASQPNSARRCI